MPPISTDLETRTALLSLTRPTGSLCTRNYVHNSICQRLGRALIPASIPMATSTILSLRGCQRLDRAHADANIDINGNVYPEPLLRSRGLPRLSG